MDLSGSTTDYQPALSAQTTPILLNNVQDLLGISNLHISPSSIFTVNSTADIVDEYDGLTTLREAINFANADATEDLIVFERALFSTAQTITLTLGELDITHNTSIIAPQDTLTGGNLVTVSGNNVSRVFEIEVGAEVNLSGLIVTGGRVTGENGGGILNRGNLTLDSSLVSNNSVTRVDYSTLTGNGGGIYSDKNANLTVSNSTVSNNSAYDGGGISSTDGTITVSNSTISNNSVSGNGGGISSTRGTITVSNSTISNNSAYDGGGISSTRGTITVSNSTISNNSASYGGGISHTSGTLKISNSTISNNSVYTGSGGGIYHISGTITVSNSTISNNSVSGNGGGIMSVGSTITVSNSTISNNSASYGGGISHSSGTLKISNSTISGNRASAYGGGIFNTFITLSSNPDPINIIRVSNSTISSNSAGLSGGGIYNDSFTITTLIFSTLTLNKASNGGGVYQSSSSISPKFIDARNTIIAANLLNEDGINPDVRGNFRSNGYNLIGDRTGMTGFDEVIGDNVGKGDNPIDPGLAALDFYGGFTQTHALLPLSPAIDAADPIILDTDPTTDQRGLPRVSGNRADIGAFEFS